MNGKSNKFSWVEALVDKKTEHLELTYKDNSDPVALIGKGNGINFIVQFLINKEQPENKEILRAVSRDIDYYLIEKREDNPWNYAKYHCTSGANP
jgi:hypothetical protein